jgi:hypothetical protein
MTPIPIHCTSDYDSLFEALRLAGYHIHSLAPCLNLPQTWETELAFGLEGFGPDGRIQRVSARGPTPYYALLTAKLELDKTMVERPDYAMAREQIVGLGDRRAKGASGRALLAELGL